MAWAEDDWERLTPYVEISLERAARLLGSLGEPTEIELLSGGKANTNYRVGMRDGRDVVLRVYERDAKSAALERRILQRVADTVPVARLLAQCAMADGTPVGVFEFVPGEHPAHRMAADPASAAPIGHAVGETLASLHSLQYDEIGLFAPDLTFKRQFDSVADSFVDLIRWSLSDGRAGERLGDPLVGELQRALPAAAESLAPLEAYYCLVHSDFKFSNILVRPEPTEWTVAALLDWEFACAFTPLLDVAILMRHRDTFSPDFVSAFAKTYGARAWLPADWRRLTRVVDLMNMVGFLNASGDRPRLYSDVIALVKRTLALL